jgi:hypothetical protein
MSLSFKNSVQSNAGQHTAVQKIDQGKNSIYPTRTMSSLPSGANLPRVVESNHSIFSDDPVSIFDYFYHHRYRRSIWIQQSKLFPADLHYQ